MYRRRGLMLTELIVTLGVVALLLACTAASLQGLRRFSHYQWTRQQCIAAAQAQLDSLATLGRDLPDQTLWPRVTLTTRRVEGEGQWRGLQRLDVTARAESYRHTVRVRLSRYVPQFETPSERQ